MAEKALYSKANKLLMVYIYRNIKQNCEVNTINLDQYHLPTITALIYYNYNLNTVVAVGSLPEYLHKFLSLETLSMLDEVELQCCSFITYA